MTTARPVTPGPRMRPGNYIERVNRSGGVVYYHATEEAIELRNSLATARGYVIGPCSLRARLPLVLDVHRWHCVEDSKRPGRFHHVHDGEIGPPGCVSLSWPDEIEAAAVAMERAQA